MKFRMIRGLVALALMIAVVALVGIATETASAASKWTADPGDVPGGAFCEDVDATAWYQVQHYDSDGNHDFTGSTVACSGWEAIAQIARIHDYASVDEAGLEWVSGNRNKPWVSSLQPISDY